MNITGMNTVLVGKNVKEIMDFYEKNFGFKVIHSRPALLGKDESEMLYIMENPEGFRLDFVSLNTDAPSYGMRINVDDFDEAVALYKAQGLTEISDVVIFDDLKCVLLQKMAATPLLLVQHLK